MRTGNLTVVILAVVLFVSYPLSAAISDHFDNGVLDSAWQISTVNLASCTYNEAGTMLTVSDISKVNTYNSGEFRLRQSFIAAGDFIITYGISWSSDSLLSAMDGIGVRTYSNGQIVTQGGFVDWWVMDYGQKYARVEEPLYVYNSGIGTLASAGTADLILKRENGVVTVWWNNSVILTGYSTSTVDTLEIVMGIDSYSGATFGTLGIDYINAIPEPMTLMLLACGIIGLRKKCA